MPDNAFLTALQKITAGGLDLAGLIDAAVGLKEAGALEQARQLYRVWISFNGTHPQLYVACFNCADLETQLGNLSGAAEALSKAIALSPDFVPAYINLGRVLERAGAPDRAIEQWKAGLARPAPVTGAAIGYALTALKQLVRVTSDLQRNEEAEAAAKWCLELNPYQRDAIEQFIALRLAQCKWPVIAPWGNISRKALMTGIHPLSMAAYTDDPLLQLASAHHYAKELIERDPHERAADDRRHAAIDLDSRRLRVGYVSSDFRDHAIGYLMAELLELHDKSEVEVFAYYCGPEPTGALNARIRGAVEHWTEIRALDDRAAAQKIAQDGIDILVDVNGHTRDARLGVFARRPAPIIVNWLGYPGSMGTPYHHYIIADDWIIPKASEIYYSEKVVRLPCYQPNDRKRAIAPVRPTRRDAGLPDDAIVFCCFNGLHKINKFTFDRWLEILRRVPGSVLWLLDGSEGTNRRIADYAEQNGVARARVIFAPRQQNAYHLARYPLADLFLDTAPYGAHTTASDALWMGVPVLTLSGRSFASRVCGSLVRSAGLPDLVCTSARDYVERAVALGNDKAAVAAYKARLEEGRGRCTLFATDKLARSLEALYRAMCADYSQGRLPRPDLTNLERYLEVGVGLDHEAQELLTIDDYNALYEARLAACHAAQPLLPDNRMWSSTDIAVAERVKSGQAHSGEQSPPRRIRLVAG
jgi:predicted O-linked N-acetylglucosamine transferase (SPINDLY family)